MQIYSRVCIGRDDETVTGDLESPWQAASIAAKSAYWVAHRVMVIR
jgi:hypothetical protein